MAGGLRIEGTVTEAVEIRLRVETGQGQALYDATVPVDDGGWQFDVAQSVASSFDESMVGKLIATANGQTTTEPFDLGRQYAQGGVYFTSHTNGEVLDDRDQTFEWFSDNPDLKFDFVMSATPFPRDRWRNGELADSEGLGKETSFRTDVQNDGNPKHIRLHYTRDNGDFSDGNANNDQIIAEGRFIDLVVTAAQPGAGGGTSPGAGAGGGNYTGTAAEKILATRAEAPAYVTRTRTHLIQDQGDWDTHAAPGKVNGGDVIEIADGLVITGGSPYYRGYKASAANPICFQKQGSGPRWKIRGSGKRDKSGSNPRRYVTLSFEDCAHIQLHGGDFSGSENMVLAVGSSDDNGSNKAATNNLAAFDCRFSNAANAGIKTLYGSSQVLYDGCIMEDIGITPVTGSTRRNKGAGNAEGAYQGRGGSGGHELVWAAEDITFKNCTVRRLGEAFDNKRHSRVIRYIGCLMDDLILWSQGAFTISINPRDEGRFSNYNVDCLIDRCIVGRITDNRGNGDQTAFCIGAGDTRIIDSIAVLPPDHVITAYQDARNSTHKRLDVEGCVLLSRDGRRPINARDNVTGSGPAPLDIHCLNNITNVPITGVASNVGNQVMDIDQLHTIFRGSAADFDRLGSKSAEQLLQMLRAAA